MSLFHSKTQLIFRNGNSQLSAAMMTDECFESHLIAGCLFIYSFQMKLMFVQPLINHYCMVHFLRTCVSCNNVFIEDTYLRRLGLETATACEPLKDQLLRFGSLP